MSELTACYFCGTALDAPVERYPLTPPSIDATTGRSVALCPTCRRKLVTVLEIVGAEFDAVVDDPAAADVDDAGDTADQPPTTAAATDSADPTAGAADDETLEADTAQTGDATAASDDGHEAAEQTDEEDEIEATPDEGDSAVTANADPVPTAGDGGAAGDDPTAEDAGPDDAAHAELLSSPEAQKVIKLLQNREFPLEREEFEIVASNAYDIPMRDCEEVIDTLVAEGYVGEDGAMLTRPA